jgi:hypothetical protein
MALINISLPSDGSTADVSDYNTPLNTVVNEFNGQIDNANIKTGAAIATSKLASDAGIVAGMIAPGAVTLGKLANDGAATNVKLAASISITASTSPTNATEEVTLEAGTWLIIATCRFNCSVASTRLANIEIRNTTDSTNLGTADLRVDNDTGNNANEVAVVRVVTLTDPKAYRMRASISSTAGSVSINARPMICVRLAADVT